MAYFYLALVRPLIPPFYSFCYLYQSYSYFWSFQEFFIKLWAAAAPQYRTSSSHRWLMLSYKSQPGLSRALSDHMTLLVQSEEGKGLPFRPRSRCPHARRSRPGWSGLSSPNSAEDRHTVQILLTSLRQNGENIKSVLQFCYTLQNNKAPAEPLL